MNRKKGERKKSRGKSGDEGRGRQGSPPGSGVLTPSGGAGALRAFSVERERVGPFPVWGWAAVSAVAVWVLYYLTLAPTTAFWDASEYIATAHILGIPHPPGNPLFVIVGRVWDVALSWTGLSVAQRINLLSATASAGAAGFWFLSITRIWAHFTESRRQLVVVGFVCVLVGATAFTVWSQSNVNEKVYTLSLFVVAVVTYLAMLWEDVADTTRGDRLILLAAYLLGLGATNHLMSVLPLGALGVFVLWHRPRTFLRPKLLSAAAALAMIGFTVQLLFVPIRSAQEPIINEASPQCENIWTALATPADFVPGVSGVVPDGVTCEPLRAAIAREQYGPPSLLNRQSPYTAQMMMFAQYFDWQWARELDRPLRHGATGLFFLLGLLGLWRHWKGDRDSFVYFATLLVILIPLLVFYLNFRYGYSLYADIPMDQREVRERDYFYLLSFNFWGLYAGMGIVTLWQELGSRLGGVRNATPVLGLAFIPLFFNFGMADRSDDFSARDWAYNVLQSVEPYGVLFTNGDNDTFPLWYLQEVEGIRQDVTVMVHSYLGTRWYPKQLRGLTRPCPEGVDPADTPTVITCQRPFDAENAAAPYRGMDVTPPTRPVLDMTDEEIDGVPGVERVAEPMQIRFAEHVTGRLEPQQLAGRYGSPVVTLGDLFVLLISRNALGDRPVYFAATAPPVFRLWNLESHLMRQGLAFNLVDAILESTVDTLQLDPGFGVRWIDVERSRTLLWDVFQVEYLLDWELWPEPSTRASIPSQYALAYFALGEALRMRNETELAEQSYVRTERLWELSGLD